MRTMMLTLAVLAVTFSAVQSSFSGNARLVCYYGSWAVDRTGVGSYSADDIPIELCTHIIYAFTGVSNETSEISILETELDVTRKGFSNFTELRSKNSEAKFLVSVGGWGEGGAKFSKMVSQNTTRANFTNSVVAFLNDYNFDGIDLDWEYPGATDRDGTAADKDNFMYLVQELREALDAVGKGWEMTAAVPLTESKLADGYRVAELCQALDAVHVMSYDLHGSWDGFVDVHSPLFNRTDDDFAKIDVNDGLMLWQENGCPANKLVVGIPFYGKTFTLNDDTTSYAPGTSINTTVGGGDPGAYTQERGTLAYYEICSEVDAENSTWTKDWEPYGMCPYAYSGTQWVGYENATSVEIKMKWLIEKGYLGAMTWALDLDDFRGLCGKKNPLLNVMYEYMSNYTVPMPPQNATETTS